jgi:hypothetical protein
MDGSAYAVRSLDVIGIMRFLEIDERIPNTRQIQPG